MHIIVTIILEISASFIWQQLLSASVIGTESCFHAKIIARTSVRSTEKIIKYLVLTNICEFG